jgi:hypothetical protein
MESGTVLVVFELSAPLQEQDFRCLIDWNIIDWNIIDWNIIDWNIIDWNIIDWNIIDWNIIVKRI